MATTQTREFLADRDVRFMMELLDYGQAPFVDEALKNQRPFTTCELKDALKVHWLGQKGREVTSKEPMRPDYRAVRSSFDGFLIWLERIEVLISNDVIDVGDFGDLFFYWLVLLGETPQSNDGITHLGDIQRKALWDYIRGYEFNLVVRLFARYARADRAGTSGFRPRPEKVVSSK